MKFLISRDESHHKIPWGGNPTVRGHPYLGPVPGQDCACPVGEEHRNAVDELQKNGVQPMSKQAYYKMHNVPEEHAHHINNHRAVTFWAARDKMLKAAKLRGGHH
jgi:hypothetical protein